MSDAKNEDGRETIEAMDALPPVWDAMAHYHSRLEQIERDVAAAAASGEAVIVLLGDSISEGHPAHGVAGYRVVNMGISGDKIAMEPDGGVLRRLDVVGKARPRHVFLMIGVNDFWHTPPKALEAAIADYAQLAEALPRAVPGARIWMLSTFPTSGEYASLNANVQELNKHVRQLAARHRATFVDMQPLMADANGALRPELTSDGIHLSALGYDVWTRELERVLNG